MARSDRRGLTRGVVGDRRVDSVHLSAELREVCNQVPQSGAICSRALKRAIQDKSTRGELTIYPLAAAKFGCECSTNLWRIVLGRDVRKRVRARGVRSRERNRRERSGLPCPTDGQR